MASGYIEFLGSSALDTDPSSGGHTFSKATLTTPSVPTDTASRMTLPSSGVYWSHVEVTVTGTGAALSNPELFLTWDSEGYEVIGGPSDGLTFSEKTSGTYALSADLGIVPTFPEDDDLFSNTKSQGTVYFWLRAAGSTDQAIRIVRLHWYEASKG